VVTNLFRYCKTRYKGLVKNTGQLFSRCGLANLFLAVLPNRSPPFLFGGSAALSPSTHAAMACASGTAFHRMTTIGAAGHHGATYLTARSFDLVTDLTGVVPYRVLRLRRISSRFLGLVARIFVRM
jgi:hypothetical protein